jgi:hypothetical protein
VTRGASARLGRFIEWLRPTPMVGRRGLRDCDGDEGAVAAKLIDASNMSLDGCTEDARGASTLAAPLTANTRLERDFDPSAVLDLKAAASRDVLVGGPNLAAQALVARLIDELALFVWPVVLGGRNPALPTDTRADLELIDEHRFSSGVVHLRYRLQ